MKLLRLDSKYYRSPRHESIVLRDLDLFVGALLGPRSARSGMRLLEYPLSPRDSHL